MKHIHDDDDNNNNSNDTIIVYTAGGLEQLRVRQEWSYELIIGVNPGQERRPEPFASVTKLRTLTAVITVTIMRDNMHA